MNRIFNPFAGETVKRCRPDCAGRTVPAGDAHKKFSSSSVKLLLKGNKNFLAATLAQLEGLRRRCLVIFFFPQKNFLSVALKSRRCHSPRNYSLRYPFGANSWTPIFFFNFQISLLPNTILKRIFWNLLCGGKQTKIAWRNPNYNTCNKHSDKKERGTGWKEVEFENNERNCMCVICTNNFFSLSFLFFPPLCCCTFFFFLFFTATTPH